jgi:beta-glucanase (GH16 family)
MTHPTTVTPKRNPEPTARAQRTAGLPAARAVFAALAMSALLAACAPAAQRPEKPAPVTPVTVIATAVPSASQVSSASLPSTSPPPVLPGYQLVFADEFNGTKLDTGRWMTQLPWARTNRGEGQYYTPESLNEGGGMLTMTAREQLTHGKPYSSGAISARSYKFTYGHVEGRIQIPAGTGFWPAFWLVTTTKSLNDEIDIMEILGSDPSQGYAVLHHGTSADQSRTITPYRNPDFSVGFHTFAIDWEPGVLTWYVDGVQRHRIVGAEVPSHPMQLIASLTVGGPTSWSGAPDRYTQFPAQMKIDYIRVYQRQ